MYFNSEKLNGWISFIAGGFQNVTSTIKEGPVAVKFVQICFNVLLFSHDDESKNTK